MARVKVTLQGTELDVRATDAQAIARYIVELDMTEGGDFTTTSSTDANLLVDAIAKVPAIGSRKGFNKVQGAPTSDSKFAMHEMRVIRHRTYVAETNNGQKPFVDVYYASRPRPVIELGSSAVQQKTQTYLSDDATSGAPADSTDPVFRKQMVVDYTIKAGKMIPAQNGAAAWPPYDLPQLKTPAEGSMFRFGSSIRISSWWYNDEVTISDLQEMQQLYTACTNKGSLFFDDDDQRWLCTSEPAITNDGGFTFRTTVEFVYSPYGWDTYAIYNGGLFDMPAILSPATQAALYTRGVVAGNSGLIPSPFPRVPASYDNSSQDQGGAGRFPQQLCRPMTALVGFVSQGIIGSQPNIDVLLRQTGGPQLFDAPDTGDPSKVNIGIA